MHNRRDLVEQEAARAGTPIYLFKTPDGESSLDVQQRHIDLWNEVSGAAGTFLPFGHGAGIACLLLRLTGHDFEHFPDYIHGSAHRTVVDADDDGHRIIELNASPNA